MFKKSNGLTNFYTLNNQFQILSNSFDSKILKSTVFTNKSNINVIGTINN